MRRGCDPCPSCDWSRSVHIGPATLSSDGSRFILGSRYSALALIFTLGSLVGLLIFVGAPFAPWHMDITGYSYEETASRMPWAIILLTFILVAASVPSVWTWHADYFLVHHKSLAPLLLTAEVDPNLIVFVVRRRKGERQLGEPFRRFVSREVGLRCVEVSWGQADRIMNLAVETSAASSKKRGKGALEGMSSPGTEEAYLAPERPQFLSVDDRIAYLAATRYKTADAVGSAAMDVAMDIGLEEADESWKDLLFPHHFVFFVDSQQDAAMYMQRFEGRSPLSQTLCVDYQSSFRASGPGVVSEGLELQATVEARERRSEAILAESIKTVFFLDVQVHDFVEELFHRISAKVGALVHSRAGVEELEPYFLRHAQDQPPFARQVTDEVRGWRSQICGGFQLSKFCRNPLGCGYIWHTEENAYRGPSW